jgi:hypothetical protein
MRNSAGCHLLPIICTTPRGPAFHPLREDAEAVLALRSLLKGGSFIPLRCRERLPTLVSGGICGLSSSSFCSFLSSPTMLAQGVADSSPVAHLAISLRCPQKNTFGKHVKLK